MTYQTPMPGYFTDATAGVAFRVDGIPAPQGSKRAFVVAGRPVLVEASKNVKPWRDAVRREAVDAMNGRAPFQGPMVVPVTFRMPRPKTVKRLYPSTRPDLDKILRATCDALSKVVYVDDGQIVQFDVIKTYGTPGADITVEEVPA